MGALNLWASVFCIVCMKYLNNGGLKILSMVATGGRKYCPFVLWSSRVAAECGTAGWLWCMEQPGGCGVWNSQVAVVCGAAGWLWCVEIS